MKADPTNADCPWPQPLTKAELVDFDLVLDNARTMGWLTAHQSLSATRSDSCVVVRDLAANVIRERRYDGARWLYQLLHELSQGLWKVKALHSMPEA